jgi:hypothetical protein
MSDIHSRLEEIDRDGAIQETLHAVSGGEELQPLTGHTRSAFLRRAAAGGGIVVGGSALLGLPALAFGADTRSRTQDIAILNFALGLEYLEAAFYAEAVSRRFAPDTDEAVIFAKTAGVHEADHVTFIQTALRSAAIKRPTFAFGNRTGDRTEFLVTAEMLEDTGVSAYIGQIYRFKQTAAIRAVAQVLAVEARHAAWVRRMRGRQPSDAGESFNLYASMREVEAAIKATGFVKS